MIVNFIPAKPANKTVIACIIILTVAGTLFICSLYFPHTLPHQHFQNTLQLNAKKIKQQQHRINQIQNGIRLQQKAYQQQNTILSHLNQVSTQIPPSCKLQQLTVKPTELTIMGLSQSEKSINDYINALKNKAHFDTAVLDRITLTTEELIKFQIVIPQKRVSS